MRTKTKIATLVAAMMFVSVHAEVREVVLHNDDIEVEECHPPERTSLRFR